MVDWARIVAVVQDLSRCRDGDAVIGVLRQAVRPLIGADGVTVVLRDGELCHYADENALGPLWKGRRFPLTSCISGWCMLHREQVAIPDIYVDSRIPHDAYRPTFVKSLAMTPIRAEDPIGAIGAYWADHHHATAEELAALQALGDAASVALANVGLIAELTETSRRKDEFLYMLAHELRNPLAPVRTFLHVLQLRPGDAAAVERACGAMERQVGHLARMVDDLLDVARLQTGKVQVRRERLDLRRLVNENVEDRGVLFARSGIGLTAELPSAPIWVHGDAERLNQVLGNVLDNAHKFTAAGGRVTVALARDEGSGEAVLRVRDTGVGIDAALLPGVFEPFAQADRSLERRQGGLGLGLAIALRVVELHEGSIAVHSEGLGMGTEIVIALPLPREVTALAAAPVRAQPAAIPAKVLVVEDNVDAAEALQALLEMSGYQVRVAHSGPEGVAAAQADPPAVVLCDVGLPGLDGFGVARALRQFPATAAARLVAVTGYGSAEDRQRAEQAGFDAFLVKPVAPTVLLGEVAAPRLSG